MSLITSKRVSGSEGISPLVLNLGRFTHREKGYSVPFEQEAMWVPEPVWKKANQKSGQIKCSNCVAVGRSIKT
jgi:hypothetical protein